MAETAPHTPSQPEATQSSNQDQPAWLGQVEATLDALDANQGVTPDELRTLVGVASRLRVFEYQAGGTTIPGTDEVVGAKTVRSYSMLIQDDGQHNPQVISIDREIGDRLSAIKDKLFQNPDEPQPADQTSAPAEQPAKKPIPRPPKTSGKPGHAKQQKTSEQSQTTNNQVAPESVNSEQEQESELRREFAAWVKQAYPKFDLNNMQPGDGEIARALFDAWNQARIMQKLALKGAPQQETATQDTAAQSTEPEYTYETVFFPRTTGDTTNPNRSNKHAKQLRQEQAKKDAAAEQQTIADLRALATELHGIRDDVGDDAITNREHLKSQIENVGSTIGAGRAKHILDAHIEDLKRQSERQERSRFLFAPSDEIIADDREVETKSGSRGRRTMFAQMLGKLGRRVAEQGTLELTSEQSDGSAYIPPETDEMTETEYAALQNNLASLELEKEQLLQELIEADIPDKKARLRDLEAEIAYLSERKYFAKITDK